jgi:hypothetical protein
LKYGRNKIEIGDTGRCWWILVDTGGHLPLAGKLDIDRNKLKYSRNKIEIGDTGRCWWILVDTG